MGFLSLFRKKKPDSEFERRQRLLKTGRITEGTILETDGEMQDEITQVFYFYTVNGSDYESSDWLTDEQRSHSIDYAPGSKVSIRYDPRQPGNSVVV